MSTWQPVKFTKKKKKKKNHDKLTLLPAWPHTHFPKPYYQDTNMVIIWPSMIQCPENITLTGSKVLQ